MPGVAILLLAAGASSRMRGADKLLQIVDDEPLIRRQARAMRDTGAPVVVTLPPNAPARRAALAGLDLRLVEVQDAGEGMSASVRAGISALPHGLTGVAVLPADMPEITTQDMEAVMGAFADAGENRIVRATGGGTPGHPVLFPARLFGALGQLRGDTGARSLLRTEKVVHVALPGNRALVDLDTPEAWDAWYAARG